MVAIVLLVLAGAYSWAVATTRPFTVGADLIVAAGFLMMGVVMGVAIRRRRRAGCSPQVEAPRLTAWVIAIAALAVLELSSYFAGFSNRHAFPTLSSLYDDAATSVVGKSVVVFCWLALGWGLFRPRSSSGRSGP